MRNTLLIILIISLTITLGCTKSNNTQNITKNSEDSNNLESLQNIETGNNNTDIINAKDVDNSFFFKNNVSQLNYNGKFLFDDIVEKEVKLRIIKLDNLKQGDLYELKLEYIEEIPNDRLSLGYFYVQKDKIYKIEPTEDNLNKLKMSYELPDSSIVVCQDKEIEDELGEDELGFHFYLKVNGDEREYVSYNNKVSTGYYESFIWKKDKGLIYYRSGYGAERDSIELELR